MSLRFQPRNNNSTTTHVSTRLHEVLVIGEQLKARQLQRRCANVSKGFANANDLNKFHEEYIQSGEKKKVEDDEMCAICHKLLIDKSDKGLHALEGIYEPIKRTITRQRVYNGCGHVFHRSCLRDWILTRNNPTCPLCRSVINGCIKKDLRFKVNFVKYDRDGRIVQKEFPNWICFYEGEKGMERLVWGEYEYVNKKGKKQIDKYLFEGEKGKEKLVRIESSDGLNNFYDGEQGKERLVRMEFPAGEEDASYFTIGEESKQRKVKEIHYFEGEQYKERKVRIEFPAGKEDASYFTIGEEGKERKVNEIHYLEGEKGNEKLVRVEFPAGEKDAS